MITHNSANCDLFLCTEHHSVDRVRIRRPCALFTHSALGDTGASAVNQEKHGELETFTCCVASLGEMGGDSIFTEFPDLLCFALSISTHIAHIHHTHYTGSPKSIHLHACTHSPLTCPFYRCLSPDCLQNRLLGRRMWK